MSKTTVLHTPVLQTRVQTPVVKVLKAMDARWREISWEQALRRSLPVARILEVARRRRFDFEEGSP